MWAGVADSDAKRIRRRRSKLHVPLYRLSSEVFFRVPFGTWRIKYVSESILGPRHLEGVEAYASTHTMLVVCTYGVTLLRLAGLIF